MDTFCRNVTCTKRRARYHGTAWWIALGVVAGWAPALPLAAQQIASPDGKIVVEFHLQDDGTPAYAMRYAGRSMVLESRLGLEPDLTSSFRLTGTDTDSHHGEWSFAFGERSTVPDNYRQLTVDLKHVSGKRLRLEFRAYDEGAALRYVLPDQDTQESKFTGERTEFRFPAGTYGYEEHGTEGPYRRVPTGDIQPWCERPLTLQYESGAYASLAEAADFDYPRMLLSPLHGVPGALVSALGGNTSNTENPNQRHDPSFTLSAGESTPWRVLVVGDRPGDLLERNYLLLNLSPPCALDDVSWIKPGKVMRDTTLTTAGAKAIIDFAATAGLDYVHLDWRWYGSEDARRGDATTVRVPNLDIDEIVRYGREKGVGLIVYVDRRQIKSQRDVLFPLYEKWGLKGVKLGFVDVGPHSETEWITDTIRKAAEHHLMLNIHDGYRATGNNRTYPNLMTVEGIRGNEHMPTAEHNCTLPFTRYIAGIGDYTVCYYDGRIKTTHAHQLAMAVVSFSPLQWILWYDKPSMYRGEPEIEFFREVPTVWDETRVVHDKIGQYATIARRSGDQWFVGTINGSAARRLQIPLDFLAAGRQYVAHVYGDDPTVTTRTHVGMEQRPVDSSTVLDVALQPGGGQAIWIRPAAATDATDKVAAVALKTETLSNPLGIDTRRPALGWQLRSSRRGVLQTAYQVRVATSAEQLHAGETNMWDSGKVESSNSAFVRYGGPPLQSQGRYWWQVRVWDNRGNVSKWSRPAWWEMGLLTPSDWAGATWIGGPPLPEMDPKLKPPMPAPQLRKGFKLADKQVKNARLYVSAGGYVEPWLNGTRVGDQVLMPGFTVYNKRIQYVSFDVTSLTRPGLNVLGAVLGRGMFATTTPTAWDWDKSPWHGEPRLLAKLAVEYVDGTTTEIVADETWRTKSGPTLRDDPYLGETYDARLCTPDWAASDHNADGWLPVTQYPAPTSNLVAQMQPPIRVQEAVTADEITNPSPGIYVFKFPFVTAGWARLQVQGPAGTEVTLRYAEDLDERGRIKIHNEHVYVPGVQTDTYILRGEGIETWEPRFSFKGFQYIEVTGYPGVPTSDSLKAVVVHSDVPRIGHFQCSDELLTYIHAITERTLLNNMWGLLTDTPCYEKNGWMEATHVTCWTAMDSFDVSRFYAKWFWDIEDSQAASGQLPVISPDNGIFGIKRKAPEWNSAFILMPWYLYQFYGDRSFLEDHYPAMKRYVDYLAAGGARTFSSMYGDWNSPGDSSPPEGNRLTATAFVYKDAQIMAQVAELLGHDDDAAGFQRFADRLRATINDQYLDRRAGSYHSDKADVRGRQSLDAIPLGFGLVPEELVPKTVASLVASVLGADDHLNTGELGLEQLLSMLTEHGHVDLAYKIVSQRTYPSWGYWIENGATTLHAGWKLGGRSRDHALHGSVGHWLVACLAGITPASPGFASIQIKPYLPTGLSHASASIQTVRGKVASSWRTAADGTWTLDVTIPTNATASVWIPTNRPEDVVEGDGPASQADGVAFNRVEAGRAVFTVGSGTYRFRTTSRRSSARRNEVAEHE